MRRLISDPNPGDIPGAHRGVAGAPKKPENPSSPAHPHASTSSPKEACDKASGARDSAYKEAKRNCKKACDEAKRKNFLDGRVLVDQGHQAPLASTAIAGLHLDGKDAAQQGGPGQPIGSPRGWRRWIHPGGCRGGGEFLSRPLVGTKIPRAALALGAKEDELRRDGIDPKGAALADPGA
jgi:hypothetical protein